MVTPMEEPSRPATRDAAYDLAVAYRVYPAVSAPAASLPGADDKYRMADVCLRSFRASLGNLRAKVWAILDGCPAGYRDLFYRYFRAEDVVPVEVPAIGNRPTFDLQLDILLAQRDAPFVYFAEDDYYYLPGQFPALVEFLGAHEDADFVSPYDHLDAYTLALHRYPSWIRAFGGRHWRTAASTCLTFLTRQDTLRRTERAFRGYARGNSDCGLWLSLTKKVVTRPVASARVALHSTEMAKLLAKTWLHGWRDILGGGRFTLWTPMPSVATHLAADLLAPGVDWESLLSEAVSRLPETELSP